MFDVHTQELHAYEIQQMRDACFEDESDYINFDDIPDELWLEKLYRDEYEGGFGE